jgi:preprotein translocase subunit SecE
MARNRQRAKERKQRQHRDPDLGPVDDASDEIAHPSLAVGGAPPDDLGRVTPVAFDDDDDDEDRGDVRGDAPAAREHAGEVAAPSGSRKPSVLRIGGFLRACWAELQRVQWPDRRQVGQATAVVLGFVVIAGAFLGLADVLARHLVDFIL